jgi:hypothetical protein
MGGKRDFTDRGKREGVLRSSSGIRHGKISKISVLPSLSAMRLSPGSLEQKGLPRSLQPRACAFANRPLARVERRRLENFLFLQQIFSGANLSQLF